MLEAGLRTIIGQRACVERLSAFANLHLESKSDIGHVLLFGPDGMGKRTILAAFAEEYNLRPMAIGSVEIKGDVTGMLTALKPGDAVIIDRIDRWKPPLLEPFTAGLSYREMRIRIGIGPKAREHVLPLAPFTCLATANSRKDCAPSIVDAFPLAVTLENYSGQELADIAFRLGQRMGLTVHHEACHEIVRCSDGTTAGVERLFAMLKRVAKDETIPLAEARRVMAVIGRGVRTSQTTSPTQLAALSGLEFERLIAELLKKMGLSAEVTKASGDGGIDIVAVLERPILGGRFLLQCKRFAEDTMIGAPLVREFYGAFKADRKAQKAIMVTTARFSTQAQQFAEDVGMELIDGKRLQDLISEGDRA